MESQPMQSRAIQQAPSPPARTKRRWLRRLLGTTAILLGVFLIVWYSFAPNVPHAAMKLVRGPDGNFVVEPETDKSGPSFEVQAGKIQANNNMTSASSVSQGNNPRLACRTILVLNQSDHLLANRVAGELLDELKQVDCVEQIEYLPRGEAPKAGALSPDVFITLDLLDLKESGLIDRQVDALVFVTMGTQPLRDNHSTIDHLTPPVIQYQWMGQLDHHSTTREVASSAAQYKLVAENVGEQLGQSIVKQLGQWREKFGLLPELPDEFYLEYLEPPELPLEGYQPRLVFSGRGLLQHNETLWECRTKGTLEDTLIELRGRLEVAGWKGNENSQDSTHLRMSNGVVQLSVFDQDGTGTRFPAAKYNATAHAGESGTEEAGSRQATFFLRYVERTTAAEHDAAVAKLFEIDAPLETLLLFERAWTKAQRERMLEEFAANPPSRAKTWLTVANLRLRNKQDDLSRDALRRAIAMLAIESQPDELKQRIKGLAKTLGDESLAEQQPEVALLREVGFVEIKPAAPVPEVEFGPDGAANYFIADDDGMISFLSLQAAAAASDSPGSYQLRVVQSSATFRQWSSGQVISEHGPVNHSIDFEGLGRVACSISKEPGQPVFRAQLEVHDEAPVEATAQQPPDGA